MPTKPGLTPKRIQLDKDKARLLIIITIASVIAVAALVVSKSLFGQAAYLSKVAGKKEQAVEQLKDNKEAVASLVESYKAFAEQNPNLLGDDANGAGERSGDNAKLILDALPSKYDFPALASSLELLLSGYTITGISGVDDVVAQETAAPGAPIEMPFSVSLTSDYSQLQELISRLHRSIRPFNVTSMQLTGTNSTLQTTINAKTYFQPERGLQITSEAVK